MILVDGKKVTANEAAKYYVYYYGEGAYYGFVGDQGYGDSTATEREKQQVHDYICKHIDRLHKFLGISKIEIKK